MDDDEDWDLPTTITSKPPQQNTNSILHQTLKITDGYKYSYEAFSSPANIDDWVEGPSYGNSRRSFGGYSQNSFRDNKLPRNDRNSNNRRFDSLKHNDSFPSKSSPRNFSTPKSNRFSSRSVPNTTAMNDWDAPNDLTDTINASWKANVIVSTNTAVEENWDDDGESMHQNHNSVSNPIEIPMFNPENIKQNNTSNIVDETDDWDTSVVTLPNNNKTSRKENQPISKNSTNKNKFCDQSSKDSSNLEQRNSTIDMEENWDADPSDLSESNISKNGFAKDLPLYNPNEQSYTNNPFNQRYENNYHSNKHPRNFELNDRFGRESFNRHSRGNRHAPYDRGTRGRGSRGGRGGRNSKDGPYNSYNSRDNSRNRAERRDNSYQHNSFNKNRNNDSTSYQPVKNSYSNIEVETEDWDSPTGFVQKPIENNTLISSIIPSAEPVEEESWD